MLCTCCKHPQFPDPAWWTARPTHRPKSDQRGGKKTSDGGRQVLNGWMTCDEWLTGDGWMANPDRVTSGEWVPREELMTCSDGVAYDL